MTEKFLNNMRSRFRMWRLIQRKNREIKERDAIIRDLTREHRVAVQKLRREILRLQYLKTLADLERKGIQPHGERRPQRASH